MRLLMPLRLRHFPAIAFVVLGACQDTPKLPTLTPYKMDIQQGNFVTQEMVSKLKPGMTPSQVRFILGTPLVVDAFHKDRWDYVYRYSKGGTLQEARRIVVVFKDDKLARIEGDVVASQPGGATEGGVRIDKPAQAPAGPATAKPAAPGAGPGAGAPKPQSSSPASGAGEPGGTGAVAPGVPAKTAEEKSKEEKPKADAPKEERGFFGRMLEKLGF